MIVPVLLFVVITLYASHMQAEEHASIIRGDGMNAGVKKWWTTMRAVLLGGLALATWLLGIAPLYSATLLFIASWCLFTSAFRWWLNAAMGWDRYYLGSTSRYDLFMISIVLFAKNWRWPNVTGIKATHQGAYKFDGYRSDVHRAGMLAYAVELIVSAACYIFALVAAGVP